MRLSIITLLIGSFVGKVTMLSAQTYANAIYRIDPKGHFFTSLSWKNDVMYVSGIKIHSGGSSGAVCAINRNGAIIDTIIFHALPFEYNQAIFSKGISVKGDTIILSLERAHFGPITSLLTKVDFDGQILTQKEFESPINGKDYCSFRDLIQTRNGYFAIEIGDLTPSDNQYCILHTDHQFNTIWRKCFGNLSREWPFDLLELPNGNILGVGFSNNLNGTGTCYPPGACFFGILLMEVDQEGNLIREWRSEDEVNEAAWAAFPVNDSLMIVSGSDGTLYCSARCEYGWTGKAMLINIRNGQKIWETSLSAGQPYDWYDSRMPDVIPSIEGDGFIFCGGGYYLIPDCRPDTMGKCWANPGIIAKVSHEGDSLWMRKYFGVYNISEANMLLDAEIVPDSSGYSFVGEAFTGWPGETQGQHGWLLMTDRYGCLVPGCHLISSDENSPPESAGEAVMKIHPNPASEFLNILITRRLDADATLSLISMNGIILDQWSTFETGATYLIPTTPYPPGMYVLTMTANGTVLDQQKVVIR